MVLLASVNGLEPPCEDPSTKIALITIPKLEDVFLFINSLKNQIVVDRWIFVKKSLKENRQKLVGFTDHLQKTSTRHRNRNLLTKRQEDAIDAHNQRRSGSHKNSHGGSTALLLYTAIPQNFSKPVMLPQIERLPFYITWVFLDRNEMMPPGQSVEGRRQIYYDKVSGETLIFIDNDVETPPIEEEKERDINKSEDFILRMTIKRFGLSDLVLDSLSECFSTNKREIKERYEILSNGDIDGGASKVGDIEESSQSGNFSLEKDLEAFYMPFNILFCRRCYVFLCRLHGCSQDLIYPAKKQTPWIPPDCKNAPCGPNCFRSVLMSETVAKIASSSQADDEENYPGGAPVQISSKNSSGPSAMREKQCSKTESDSSNAKNLSRSCDSENGPVEDIASSSHSTSPKTKSVESGIDETNNKRMAERVLVSMQKRQKKSMASDSYSIGETLDHSSNKLATNPRVISCEDNTWKEFAIGDDNQQEFANNESWKPLEKGLLDKGLQIFGANSCLIAKNLLSGLKTCWEVYRYINFKEGKMSLLGTDGIASNSLPDGYFKGKNTVRGRRGFLKRRRPCRLKYRWRTSVSRSIRKRISKSNSALRPHYSPCDCQGACTNQCPCQGNGAYCEKFCGCPVNCKNRFGGCHCVKSECRSRLCPCFAANRECDPDICKNCWVSCGDGTLGSSNLRDKNHQCRNMKFLLGQHRKIVLGKSVTHGWGAFIQDVEKDDYIGEYTGEIITHREADKRGKIYDIQNSSFLFNLDDKYVLDAHRKGNKLKFANHSFIRIAMQRVGIFASKKISAGAEIFYDYKFLEHNTPVWARELAEAESR